METSHSPDQIGNEAPAGEFVPPGAEPSETEETEAPRIYTRPCPPVPTQPVVYSERAKRLLSSFFDSHRETSAETLWRQSKLFSALFEMMLLENAESETFNEKTGIHFALRAERQARESMTLLERLRAKEERDERLTDIELQRRERAEMKRAEAAYKKFRERD